MAVSGGIETDPLLMNAKHKSVIGHRHLNVYFRTHARTDSLYLLSTGWLIGLADAPPGGGSQTKHKPHLVVHLLSTSSRSNSCHTVSPSLSLVEGDTLKNLRPKPDIGHLSMQHYLIHLVEE